MTDGPAVAVAVIGVDHRPLVKAGITDVALLDGCDLGTAVFDETTHDWVLPTCRAGVVVTDQIRSGRENLTPYLGVAVHGVPNYFMVSEGLAEAQLGYIARCLALMRRTGSSRIEVLFSSQRLFHLRSAERLPADESHWRRMAELAPTAFDLSSHVGVAEEVFDGAASMRIGDDDHAVRARLTGRLDPIDGRYHWQGTLFGLPDDLRPCRAMLTVDERTVECRITERTQQGGYSVAGVGAPPYALMY